MGYKGNVRYRVAKGRLIKLTVFGAAGWFLAMAGNCCSRNMYGAR